MGEVEARTGDWLVLYGSLMRGLGAMESLGITARHIRYAGPCTCSGELFDLGDYPGLRPGSARVVGELHALIDPSVLTRLDDFEGYDPARPRESLYTRQRTELVEPAATTAWIYVYNRVPDARARIASGNWRSHLASKPSAEAVGERGASESGG